MKSITIDSYLNSIECVTGRAEKSAEDTQVPAVLTPTSREKNARKIAALFVAPIAIAACWLACSSTSHGQNAAASALRLPTFALPEGPQTTPPPDRQLAAVSPTNGTEIKSRLRLDGCGELTVKNGTPYDAIVNVVEPRTRRVVRSFYVQSRKNFVEKNLAPDAYDVYFSTGKDWDSKSRLFQDDAYYGRLERPIWFYEREDPLTGKTEYRGYEITLQSVEGGDSAFLPVDRETFQALMNQSSDSAQLEPHPANQNQPKSN